jgi:hypothetical protein
MANEEQLGILKRGYAYQRSVPLLPAHTGYVRVHVWCRACKHQADADLRFRGTNCGSHQHTDVVVMAKDSDVRPWRGATRIRLTAETTGAGLPE